MEMTMRAAWALAAAAEEEGRLFGLDLQLIHDAVLLGINIFILFLVLSYLLFRPAREYLQKRRDGIRSDLDSARQAREEAAALKMEYEGRLAGIRQEEERILYEARKKARLQEEEILREAKEEAARMKKRAEREISLEYRKARDDMKKEIVTTASLLAEKAVSARMNVQIQEELLEETLKGIGEQTWQER